MLITQNANSLWEKCRNIVSPLGWPGLIAPRRPEAVPRAPRLPPARSRWGWGRRRSGSSAWEQSRVPRGGAGRARPGRQHRVLREGSGRRASGLSSQWRWAEGADEARGDARSPGSHGPRKKGAWPRGRVPGGGRTFQRCLRLPVGGIPVGED